MDEATKEKIKLMEELINLYKTIGFVTTDGGKLIVKERINKLEMELLAFLEVRYIHNVWAKDMRALLVEGDSND